MPDLSDPAAAGDALARLQAAVHAFAFVADEHDLTAPGAHLRVGSIYHRLGAEIARCEQAGYSRETICGHLTDARLACRESPFLRRTQEWPSGYPGDFETVEYLMAQTNRAPAGTLAWHLEAHSLGAPIAQQHRNKVCHQARLLTDLLADRSAMNGREEGRDEEGRDDEGRGGDESRKVLILGSGAAPDLRLVPPALIRRSDVFVLNDIDGKALALARDLLGPVAENCRFMCGNVLTNIARLAALGPYDLVLAGGMFDYVDRRCARFVTSKVLTKLCRPGGMFYFATIGPDNPYRWWTTYLLDWAVTERDESAICALLEPARAEIASTSISTDPTGLTLLTHVRRRTGRELPQAAA